MEFFVKDLTGLELDAWVAKARGSQILGKALVYNDPESGTTSISPDQVPSYGTFMATRMHYCGVLECTCHFYKEANKSLELEIDALNLSIDSDDDDQYKDLENDDEPMILGHYYLCLKPVDYYSSDAQDGMFIVREERIALIPSTTDLSWTAMKNGISMSGQTELEAAMRLYVYLTFGEVVNDTIICL